MTIEDLKAEWGKLSKDSTILSGDGGLFAMKHMDKLLAVAAAADDEALLWNEEYCNQDECDELEKARVHLVKALDNLLGEK